MVGRRVGCVPVMGFSESQTEFSLGVDGNRDHWRFLSSELT